MSDPTHVPGDQADIPLWQQRLIEDIQALPDGTQVVFNVPRGYVRGLLIEMLTANTSDPRGET